MRFFALLLCAVGFVSSLSAQNARFFRVAGPVPTKITAFNADGHVTWTNAPTNATFTVQTAVPTPGPSNWVDYIQVRATNVSTTEWLFDPKAPASMTLIPAGVFQMGDALNDGWSPDGPVHTNYVSAIYMDKFEVTKALWDSVFQWATNHGYSFTNSGLGKALNHPVHSVNWYDVVKWCNARSEMEGKTPAYYTESLQTNIYRTGEADVQNDWVNWQAGYRLPTEAEWEKAARAGIMGRRFSWADTDTISHERANYYSTTAYAYDVSATRGFNTNFNDGVVPYTAPVNYFPANGYGLSGTTGNVAEWCWDKYDSTWYSQAAASDDDTRGPLGMLADDAARLVRGGAYGSDSFNCRVAYRRAASRSGASPDRGFRTVLPVPQ